MPGLHGKLTCFSKSLGPGDGRAGRGGRGGNGGSGFNRVVVLAHQRGAAGQVMCPFPNETLASTAHCCHLSSTDSDTVQPAASQASSPSIMAAKPQGRSYSCAHSTEEEM